MNRRASECLSDAYGGCVVARRLELERQITCGTKRFCCAGKADCSDDALCCLQPGGGAACVPT